MDDNPKSDGLCIYLKGDVLDAVGELDSSFTVGSLALDDWTMRAQAMGFVSKRANHVLVYHTGAILKKSLWPARQFRSGESLIVAILNWSTRLRDSVIHWTRG